MKKIGIIVTDGVGIRNYLYSNVIKELIENNSKVILYHNLSKEALNEVKSAHNHAFENVILPKYTEEPLHKFYRELICLSRLKSNIKLTKNSTLIDNWSPNLSKFKNKVFYKIISLLSVYYCKSYNRILNLEKRYDKSLSNSFKNYEQIIKDTNPSVVLNTHQRSIDAIPFVYSLKINKTLTIGAIFSWDNLPKARISVKTDKYIVWSSFMKDELKAYYPEIDQSDVVITGTPQFDFYSEKHFIIDRIDFCKKYDLNPDKKIICFSGNDLMSSPYEEIYLEQIINKINEIDEFERPQIILRRNPVDLTGRFNNILKKYSFCVKEIAPLWNFDKKGLSNWSLVYPKFNDVKLLINTVYHSDVVINVGSTVAHDFAIYKKPVIYINYNLYKDSKWSVDRVYQFQHFKSMGDLEPVFWLNNKKNIKEVVLKALNSNEKTSQVIDGQKWLNIISNERKNVSKNIANLLIQ